MTFGIWSCCSAPVEVTGEALERQRTVMVSSLNALGAMPESEFESEVEARSESPSVSMTGDEEQACHVVDLQPAPLSQQQQALFETMAALRRRSEELLAQKNRKTTVLEMNNAAP